MIDTLKIARRLTAAGMDKAQAEAISGALARSTRQCVTKEEIRTEVTAATKGLEVQLMRLAITLTLTAIVGAVGLALGFTKLLQQLGGS